MMLSSLRGPRYFRSGVALAAVLSCFGIATHAQQQTAAVVRPSPADVSQTTAELEGAFWQCDYSFSKGNADRYKAAICGRVIEGIQKQKFNGDIERLLQWWQQNHAIQHRKLAEQDIELPLP